MNKTGFLQCLSKNMLSLRYYYENKMDVTMNNLLWCASLHRFRVGLNPHSEEEKPDESRLNPLVCPEEQVVRSALSRTYYPQSGT